MVVINSQDNLAEWTLMMLELEEVKDHVASLASQMGRNGSIDEEDFKVQVFHLMTHLNRLWNSRNFIGGLDQKTYEKFPMMPSDFIPMG